MGVEVRPATEADIGAVQAVARAAWHEAHAPIVGVETVEDFLDQYYGEEAFRRYLDGSDSLLAVATAPDDEVVGFVSVQPDSDSAGTFQLGRIYVDPDRWGEGIGQRLLTFIESAVTDRGGDRISLGVMAENDRAVSFYEAAGFDRVDEFYDDQIGADGYTYEKSL